MNSNYLFVAFFVAVLGFFAWRYFRNGRTLTGTLLGGRITQEIGEVALSQGSLMSQVLRVSDMQTPGGERFVALAVVSKAPFGASMVPYRLSLGQARQLASLLQRASGA